MKSKKTKKAASVAPVTVCTVATKPFTKELAWVARFLETRSTIPILSCVLLEAAGGILRLTATDLEVGAVSELELNTQPDVAFKAVVPVKQLLKYLGKVDEAEIVLDYREVVQEPGPDGKPETTARHMLVRHGEDSSVRLDGMSTEHFPELPKRSGVGRILKGLKLALPRIAVSISDETSRFTLNGALVFHDDAGTQMVSTDGHRLSLIPLEDSFDEPFRAMIPSKALHELKMWGIDEVNFSLGAVKRDDKSGSLYSFFVSGSRQILTRNLTGSFPDHERVMPRAMAHTVALDSAALKKSLERVLCFTDGRGHFTRWDLNGKLTVASLSSDHGHAKSSVACEWPHSPFAIGLKGDYVLEFLAHAKESVTLGVNQPDKAVVFEVPGWKYVLMPCRI